MIPTDEYDENVFCLVYKNRETGEIIGYHGLSIYAIQNMEPVKATLFKYENGTMKKMGSLDPYEFDSTQFYWYLEPYNENGISAYYTDKVNRMELPVGYGEHEEYYFVLDGPSGLEAASCDGPFMAFYHPYRAQLKDSYGNVADEICPADRTTIPYGCLNSSLATPSLDFEDYVAISLFFESGASARWEFSAYKNDGVESDNSGFDVAPINHGGDPYFQITGEEGIEDIFVAHNSERRVLDTLYGFGYQTAFILDSSVDMSHIKPTFEVAEGLKVHSGFEQISGESVKSFSEGPFYYTVHNDEAHRNYNVEYAKQVSGPQLYVMGPEKRSIYLNEYFDNRHDILIANIGSEPLTGLKVELIDAVNIKLDDYWTVGGTHNDTLAAFSTIVRQEPSGETDYYGELPNFAKI